MLAGLVYPHQLFSRHPAIRGVDLVVLVEDPLLFSQYQYHEQKLVLHRASLKRFGSDRQRRGKPVHYVECGEQKTTGDIANILRRLGALPGGRLLLFDEIDFGQFDCPQLVEVAFDDSHHYFWRMRRSSETVVWPTSRCSAIAACDQPCRYRSTIWRRRSSAATRRLGRQPSALIEAREPRRS